MKYVDYITAVRAIAEGYFDENNYVPEIGKGNTVKVYCDMISENAEIKALNIDEMGVFNYIDTALEMIGTEFFTALKDDAYFSFGCAVRDAKQIVEQRKAKILHENKLEKLLDMIMEKVEELDKNTKPEDMEKIVDALKNKKPLDEKMIAEEYWKKRNTEEQERA